MVRDYTNGFIKIYFDGVEVMSHVTTDIGARQSTGDALIGDGYSGNVDGKIDGVGIWNKALTPSEVLSIYDIQNAGQELI